MIRLHRSYCAPTFPPDLLTSGQTAHLVLFRSGFIGVAQSSCWLPAEPVMSQPGQGSDLLPAVAEQPQVVLPDLMAILTTLQLAEPTAPPETEPDSPASTGET